MKKNVMIIFGGKSGEHEVSVNSALSIEANIDRQLFDTTALGIAHNGSWCTAKTISELIEEGKVVAKDDRTLPNTEVVKQLLSADVIFPIIHGTNGEDGTLQGLLELANVPYVGSRVLGSATSMDKVIQKQLCSHINLPQADFFTFTKPEWDNQRQQILDDINKHIKYPNFVKPANLGSSVGISKVKSQDDLIKAIEIALQYDNKILVEEGIENILEVEVSVLGNQNPEASVCGSIHPNTEFYDYETKYITDDIVAKIPAEIPNTVSEEIRKIAIEAYQVLNCQGLARVDFFYQRDHNRIVLNEINTLPGFTKISMYPKLWSASGLNYTDLITKLINLGQESWQNKQQLKYTY